MFFHVPSSSLVLHCVFSCSHEIPCVLSCSLMFPLASTHCYHCNTCSSVVTLVCVCVCMCMSVTVTMLTPSAVPVHCSTTPRHSDGATSLEGRGDGSVSDAFESAVETHSLPSVPVTAESQKGRHGPPIKGPLSQGEAEGDVEGGASPADELSTTSRP